MGNGDVVPLAWWSKAVLEGGNPQNRKHLPDLRGDKNTLQISVVHACFGNFPLFLVKYI